MHNNEWAWHKLRLLFDSTQHFHYEISGILNWVEMEIENDRLAWLAQERFSCQEFMQLPKFSVT